MINLLARKYVAKVSSGVFGCTTPSHHYDISPTGNADHTPYRFWDTAGLNEGEQGTVPARDALDLLYNLVKGLRNISLVIYCVRGARFTDIARVNYDLSWGIMCEGRVPIVLVVTGLEQESDMDQWWTNYGKDVKGMGMTFEGHACVTTTKGRNNLYEQEYLQSADKVWTLVQKHCLPDPLTLTAEWISEVPKRMEAYMREYIARSGKERKFLPKPRRPRPQLPMPSSVCCLELISS